MMRGAMPAWAALICVAWVCLMLPTSVYAFIIMEATVTGAIPPEQADIARGWLASSNTYSTSFTISTSAFTSGAGIGAAIVAAANTIQASAVFGLYDDAAIEAASTTLGNLVLFGPYSQSMEVRKWSNQLYFMTADPMAELISLLNYAVSMDAAGTANLGTIGWMYLTGVAGATTEPLSTAFYNQVSQLGYNTPVAYTADASSAFNSAADFFALNPSSIFIFGQRGEHTTSFVTALGKTTNLINNKFIAFAPFALLQSLSGGSGSLTSNNMVFSSLVPPPKSTTYAAATAFTKAITASYNGMPGTYLGSVGGLYAFYGWIAMEQAIYAINLYGSTSGTPNPTGLQTALFMQNRYVIGNDYILGDYGGSCGNSVVGAATGAACECNQGGRYVAIITVSAGAVTKKSETTYPRFDCYTKANAVGGPSLAVSMFSLSDDTTSSYLNQQVQNAFTAVTAVGAAQTYLLQSKQSMSFASMPVTTTADAAAGLTSFAQPKLLSAVAGPLPAGFNPANYSNILFIEPMFSDTGALSLSLDNVIYVTATLEQQIYVLASYIADRIGLIAKPNPNDPKYTETMEMRTANAVVRTADPDPLLDVIEKSVNQFGLPLSNKTAVAAGDSLISAMGKNGFYFVFGLTAAEIPELLTFLTDNLQAVVFVSFNDITNLYSNFESTFDTAPVATLRRLFFATDVITWTATSNAADIVEKYIGNSPVIYQTPASVRGFIAAIALDRATQGIANNNGKTIFNNFMNIQSFSVGNNGYGPYYRTCPTTPADYPSACLKNYGGRNIAVLAWRNLVDDSFPLPKIRSSPSLVYTADVVTSTTTRTSTIPPCSHRPQTRKPAPKHSGMIAGLILLSLLLLLLILLVLWLCCISCFCCSNTDSQNASVAPTDATKPVTMIYISVYKWAEVSSAAPEASSQALSELRNLVRRVVAKNKCYEVGTLNDAFIVASRVARDGVRMAMELQQGMRGVGGVGQSDIDRAYYSLLKEGPGTGKGAMHGLRLRVGIHTDQVDIRLDPTTGVYQYRGPGVILSAFTNRLAHGGQILVTENTCNSFSERELNKLETIPIGAQRYPDIREPVNVYEVVAVPGRKHPAARPETAPSTTADLLSEMPLVCATFKETEGGDNADMGKLNKTIQVVLRVLYSTFPVADRIELLQHLCREASLKELKRSNFATDDAFSNALIDLLSMRAATFVITAADVTRAKGGVANNTMGMTSPAKGGDFSPVESEMQQFEDPKKPAMQEEYAYPNEGTDERVQARNAAMADVSSDSSSFHL